MRALIIDDSRAIRSLIGGLLKELGFETVGAENGGDGLAKLKEQGPFEVACVDWNMPVMNGIEFVQTVRADPSFAAMQILMVTTESEGESVEIALTAGANEYLMKPFSREALKEKLQLMGIVGL